MVVIAAVGTACDTPTGVTDPPTDDVAMRVAALPDAVGVDVVAVWICRVPDDTVAPVYGRLPLRLDLTADEVVERAGSRLARYWSDLSHGLWTVQLAAGGEIELGPDEDGEDCVDRAIDQQIAVDRDRAASGDGAAAGVVLAVADAEHVEGAAGGFGTDGGDAALTCLPGCTLATARRAAYVGASDFHPSWGPVPALDLIEHELGHTLGLPHSGTASDGDHGNGEVDEYTSPFDVMSDSAAPRAVDPAVLDAPDTIAIDRLALGWLSYDIDVERRTEHDVDHRDVTLLPSVGPAGGTDTRLLVLDVDHHRSLTVELLVPVGYDAHLAAPGIAVHLVDDTDGLRLERRQATITPQLLGAGTSLDVEGWRITVLSVDATSARLAVERPDR